MIWLMLFAFFYFSNAIDTVIWMGFFAVMQWMVLIVFFYFCNAMVDVDCLSLLL